MPKVKNKTANKIGLFSAMSMLIGSIIGIGIFFKNGNVFAINDGNAVGILVAWILSGVISLSAAFSFAEVGSSINSQAGLGGWCYRLVGKSFGRFVKIVQPFFYFSFLAFSIAIFASEAIFNIFGAGEKVHFSIIMIVGLCLFVGFLIFNYYSLSMSAKFQWVFTSLKFVPLLIVVLGGLIFGVMNPSNSLFNPDNELQKNTAPINFTSILISIPSILFAFDPFFGVGNLSKDMIKPKKNVPLTIVISIIIVTIFYLLVTLSQILVGEGNIYSMFGVIFASNEMAKNIMNIIISIFILVSIIGVLNAFCAMIIRSFYSLIDERLVAGVYTILFISEKLVYGKQQTYKGALVLALCSFLTIFIAVLIPSSIYNTDAFVDGISNFPVTFFFGVYGTVIGAGVINRFTNHVAVTKVKGFLFFGILATVGCFLVSLFQLFYTFTTATILNPYASLAWGLFSTNGFVTQQWMGTLFLFIYLLAMILYYWINHHKTLRYARSPSRWAEVGYY